MTHHPALTLSRSLGSGGTEAGFRVARELGWQFCDRRILRMAAEALGQSVASLGLQEERPCGFWDQLLGMLAFGSPEAPYSALLELPVYGTAVYEAQRQAMVQVVAHAPSVLVGRGSFVALKGRPATLHARIHSDLEFRIQNLVTRGKVPDAEAARLAIAISDRDRAAFIRDLSGRAWDDPNSFQIVLDVSRTGMEGCVKVLVEACRRLPKGD